MTKIDLTTSPYFDDYSDKKGFYKILFRPGRSLQARELTQIQSIIQKQLERFGSHIFKERALVYPSTSIGCSYSTNTVFVKIPRLAESLTETEANIKNYWLNQEVRTAQGVSGTCVGYSITGQYARLYIDLKKASTDGSKNNYAAEDVIYVDVLSDTSELITTVSAKIESTTNSVGRIAAVEIPKDSIYFYNGYFVLVDNQFLFIEPSNPEDDTQWSATPTCIVCLEMVESIVTFEDDETLLDNANGSTNYAAPGGDRLRIQAKITTKEIGTTDQNIIKLLTLRSGIIQTAHQLDTDPYNTPLKDQLAKRTYDESGNYTVRPFLAEALPFLSDSTNRGVFLEDELSFIYNGQDSTNQAEAYRKAAECARDIFELSLNEDGSSKVFSYTRSGTTRYYPGTSYNTPGDPTSFKNLCDDRIGITVDPGCAYVRGYQQEKNGITYTSVRKSRTSDFISDKTIQTPLGINIRITNVIGFPTVQSSGSEASYGKINLHRQQLSALGAPSEVIGTARICSIELFSGTKGQQSAVYKLFVFDMNFVDGFDWSDVKSVSNANGPTFLANTELRDATVDPSLKFTGTIKRADSFSTTELLHTYSETSGRFKVEITSPASPGANTPSLLSAASSLSVGTIVAFNPSAGTLSDDIQIRQITHSELDDVSSPTKLTIYVDRSVDVTKIDLTTSAASLTVKYKVLGVGTLWKSNPGEKLEAGDMVSVGTGDKKSVYVVYSTPVNDTELNLIGLDGSSEPSAGAWEDNSVMNYLISTSVQDDSLGSAGLVYRLPHNMVRTICGGEKNAPNTSIVSTTYVVRRYVKATVSNHKATFSLTNTTDEKLQAGYENYHLVNLDTGAAFELYSAGTSISGSNKAKVEVSDHSVTFDFPGTSTTNVGAILSVEKSNSAAKAATKTLVKGSFDAVTDEYTGGGVLVITNSDNKQVSLKYPDVLRITRIVESQDLSKTPSNKKTDPSNPDRTIDGDKIITGAYTLDNGQTDYYYGISKAVLRTGFNSPKGQIRIEFDYFTHSTTGDYFSVDSYPWKDTADATASMSYDDIPSYNSSAYGQFDLKGCLDFRAVVKNDVSFSSTENGDLNFERFREVPKSGVTCSYHVYESRKDKLYINTDGLIKIKYGVPGILSAEPADPTDGLTLYDVELMPYTSSHKSCVLSMRDNRRYTMRDIGKLENRIKQLEYYTTLSLLERDTKDLIIKDALGNDKFKHGFMTDSFENNSVSDVNHPDYQCAPETSLGELRPKVFEENVRIIEKNSLSSLPNSARFAQNYKKGDGIFTLHYTNTSFLEQPLASRLINVNPYQVHSFIGSLKLSPATDSWRETKTADAITVYDSGAYDLASRNYGPNNEKIIWSDSEKVWTGISTDKQKVGGRSGQKVLAAGHSWPAKMGEYRDKKGNLIHGTGRPKNGDFVKVPPGYENAGELVKFSGIGSSQSVYETTTTVSGYEQATGIKNSLKDLGFTNPVSIGSKIVEVKSSEFIRSNEISFAGKGFLPNSTMYAYFDDVDVTRFCVPEAGFGERLDSGYTRGPISNLRVVFGEKSITLQTSAALNATDSSNRSLSNFGFNDITPSNALGLSTESILSNPVTIAKDADNKWYVSGTNFENELISGSVLVVDGVTRTVNGSVVPAEYEVLSLGDASGSNTRNTKALLKTPPTGTPEVTTVGGKNCADKLEALQRLYIGKFIDIKGSQDSTRNILDTKIIDVEYIPANAGTQPLDEPKLTLKLETANKMTATPSSSGESDISISIKTTQNSANTTPPSTIALQCDSTGTIKGKFIIPDPKVDGNPKFKTGERVFRLTNSPANENLPTVSRSDTKYTARGWVDVTQETFYSTRAFMESAEAIAGDRTPISLQDTYKTLGKVCPKDPIAQGFVVQDTTGIFITAIDVFFYSKDPSLPVELQIRPMSDDENPSTTVMYEAILDSRDVVVNKLDLAKQELTVLGKAGDVWDTEEYTGSDINRVTSANYDKGLRTTRIQHGVPFKYTVVNGEANPAGDMIPTRFVFDRPIYLSGKNTGYCFAILSNSTQSAGSDITGLEQTYQVYIAQTGKINNSLEAATPIHRIAALEAGEEERNYILGTQKLLGYIPTLKQGALFKSSGGRTWESDQTAQIKFKIHKAKFDITKHAEIDFVNDTLTAQPLTLDPFETVTDQSYVRVYHRNHNIPYDTSVTPNLIGKVRFIGVGTESSLNGIPYQTLIREEGFTIISPTLDSYYIDVNEPVDPTGNPSNHKATSSGRTGGFNVFATSAIRFEELELLATVLDDHLPETNITWNVSAVTSRAAYDPSQKPYQSISDVSITPNETVVMPTSAQICSPLDEKNFLGQDHASLKITATLTSTDENVSPVIDEQRMSVKLRGVRLDNPSGLGEDDTNINSDLFDQYVCLPTSLSPVVEHKLSGTISVGATDLTNKLYFTDTDNKLTGSSFTANQTTITGVGSLFTIELAVGDIVKHPANSETRKVVEVVSDTTVIIDNPFSAVLNGSSTLEYNPPYLKIKTANANVAVHLSKLDVGKYLSLEGTSDRARDFSDVKVLSVNYTPTSTLNDAQLDAPCLCEIVVDHHLASNVDAGFERGQDPSGGSSTPLKLTQLDRFIDEIAPTGGSCASKYVSKTMKIVNSANTLKILFDGCRPEYSYIDLYYKTGNSSDAVSLDSKNWIKVDYSVEENGKLRYSVPDNNPTSESFSAYEANVLQIQPFTLAKVKIVLRGGSAPLYPKVKNLRILALEE